ncbi:PREDICTED: uncharacterized protein LOC106744559 isoform X2 [Dinoponera quadriceps]|uniref:Uncharacterized protein LOC106744559 isoform X2 n=1 Tax=Dinoponera quadriceps TaxID=609295 RepID=A0A6P3XAM5_DINQU|nr:PREDICTED: uncharacterized protein LOC106744559 isoform X2 [Dinoponera quadriceps]
MSESDDSDILADIKALDDALMLEANDKTDDLWHDSHDDSSLSMNGESEDSQSENEYYIQSRTEFMNAYEVNKKLLKGLMMAKKKVSVLLQQCEEKLEELSEEIEAGKDGRTLNERARYSIVGMPYFKDKRGFQVPKNPDTRLKEARGELSVIHLRKPCRWSGKDRTTLLNGICDEVFQSLSISGPSFAGTDRASDRRNSSPAETTANKEPDESGNAADSSAERTLEIPINFNEMVGPIGEREFDWMKIATQYFENKHSASECRSMWNVYLHPDIKKSDWTAREDKELLRRARECNYQDWNGIATKLDTKRSAYQCFIRFNTIHNLPVRGRNWSKLEDSHLQLVINRLQIGNYIPWAEVATYMDNRTKQQVYTRWMYRKAPHLAKGRFTYFETQTLLKAVNRYGTNFGKISRCVMPHRTSVQLNGHYHTILCNKRNTWAYEDDVKLIKLYKKYRNDWVEIAKNFSHKTRTQVRQRYRSLQRFVNRGYNIFSIPRPYRPTLLNSRNTGASSSASTSSNSVEPNANTSRCNISSGTVRARLFENLNYPPTAASTSSQELYDAKELARNAKELHDVLKLLDANLDISNHFFDYAHLSKKERQLFTSLKKYTDTRDRVSSDERDKIIEEFRCRMFGPETEVTPHFVPPLPFNGEKFLIDVPADMVTPCNVNSCLVSVEEEMQFHKLSQLLIDDSYGRDINSYAPLKYNPSLTEVRTRASLRLSPDAGIKVENCGTAAAQSYETRESTNAECANENDAEMDTSDAIAPCHETLLGLKNLFYWKMLFEYERNKFCPTSRNGAQQAKSPEHERAYQILKVRLMRLFKLPLALSRVMINVSKELIFLTEESMMKSSEKRARKKKTIFANSSVT